MAEFEPTPYEESRKHVPGTLVFNGTRMTYDQYRAMMEEPKPTVSQSPMDNVPVEQKPYNPDAYLH